MQASYRKILQYNLFGSGSLYGLKVLLHQFLEGLFVSSP